MRDMVGVFAILGGIIELIASWAGPQLATVGTGSDPGPGPDPIAVAIGYAMAVLSIVGGAMVLAGRNGQRWGVTLIAAGIVGSVAAGPASGFYIFGGVSTVIAGVLALFTRQDARGSMR